MHVYEMPLRPVAAWNHWQGTSEGGRSTGLPNQIHPGLGRGKCLGGNGPSQLFSGLDTGKPRVRDSHKASDKEGPQVTRGDP